MTIDEGWMTNDEWMYSIDFLKNRSKRKQGITEEKEVKTYDLEERLVNFDELVKSHFAAWIPAFAGMTDFISIRY